MDKNFELVILIIKEWHLVEHLRLVNKALYRQFMKRHMIIPMVEYFLKGDPTMFPTWLGNPINIKYMQDIIPKAIANIDTTPVKKIQELSYHGDRFVAGGHIVQKAYNQKWESDVDVWIQSFCTDFVRQGNIDLIRKTHYPPRCLAEFDLSCCQIGILYASKHDPQIYLTPLFLYTYYTKQLIVLLHPYLKLCYPVVNNMIQQPFSKYFQFHHIWQHSDEFLECGEYRCASVMHKKGTNYSRLVGRISKYKKRLQIADHSFVVPVRVSTVEINEYESDVEII